MKQKKKIRVFECPCGSGKPTWQCHLDFDGRLRKHLPSLRPPGPLTGYSHPGCYLRSTNDCCDQISGEHYMSEAILQRFEGVRVSGMHWQKPGEEVTLAVSALKANILCRRHNSALAPLDAEAGLFFAAIDEGVADLKRKTLSRKPTFRLISGDAIELWMLKVACGLYFAVGAHDGVKLSSSHSIDIQKVRRAFFDRQWDPGGGLYFKGAPGERFGGKAHRIGMAPLSDNSAKRCCGTSVSLAGYRMEVVFDTVGVNYGPNLGLVRRPTELVWSRFHRQLFIVLSWPPGTPEARVPFRFAGGV